MTTKRLTPTATTFHEARYFMRKSTMKNMKSTREKRSMMRT